MDREKIIENMNIAKAVLCNPNMVTPEMCIKIGQIISDALSLLKKQEAVEPVPPTNESDLWKCGNCNHQLFRCTHQKYCEKCGKRVKWENDN